MGILRSSFFVVLVTRTRYSLCWNLEQVVAVRGDTHRFNTERQMTNVEAKILVSSKAAMQSNLPFVIRSKLYTFGSYYFTYVWIMDKNNTYLSIMSFLVFILPSLDSWTIVKSGYNEPTDDYSRKRANLEIWALILQAPSSKTHAIL